MGQKEVVKNAYVCSIYGSISYEDFIEYVEEIKNDILKKYPEAFNWNLEFFYKEDLAETDVLLYYRRLETPDEMYQRLQSETIAKDIKLAQIHNFVDANKEEILKYLNKQ